jgi:hypothetical protein
MSAFEVKEAVPASFSLASFGGGLYREVNVSASFCGFSKPF